MGGVCRSKVARHGVAGVARAVGRDKGAAVQTQRPKVAVMETLPEFGLPQAVEALDGGLEAGLARRGKNGHHALGQAKADQPTEAANGAGRACKTGVIVHLQINRSSPPPPVRPENGGDGLHPPTRGRRFGQHQLAPQGNGIEHLHRTLAAQLQSLHHVELVEFRPTGADLGQIPPRRRRGIAPALLRQDTPTPQDPSDRADAGRAPAFSQQDMPDRLRSNSQERHAIVASGSAQRCAAPNCEPCGSPAGLTRWAGRPNRPDPTSALAPAVPRNRRCWPRNDNGEPRHAQLRLPAQKPPAHAAITFFFMPSHYHNPEARAASFRLASLASTPPPVPPFYSSSVRRLLSAKCSTNAVTSPITLQTAIGGRSRRESGSAARHSRQRQQGPASPGAKRSRWLATGWWRADGASASFITRTRAGAITSHPPGHRASCRSPAHASGGAYRASTYTHACTPERSVTAIRL